MENFSGWNDGQHVRNDVVTCVPPRLFQKTGRTVFCLSQEAIGGMSRLLFWLDVEFLVDDENNCVQPPRFDES